LKMKIQMYKIMKYFQTLSKVILLLLTSTIYASEVDAPVTIDSRIKTFVYSENEIFPVVLHYGYQTAIEFGKDETIQTYSVGNQFVWQFSAVGRTLFIRPLEDNIITNMTVITNKRRYYFELSSKMLAGMNDEEISYVVRFFYADNSKDKILLKTSDDKPKNDNLETIKPYNFNYTISGMNKEKLSLVFDNGISTFFKFENINKVRSINCNGKNFTPRIVGNYMVINSLCNKAYIDFEGKRIIVNSK
jgi:type IV secretion system protein VirB9